MITFFKSIILFILVTGIVSVNHGAWANSADYRFNDFSHIPELANIVANDVLRDKWGFVWIASESGLYRWDGYEVKHFVHKPGELSDDYVYRLHQDKQGMVWIGLFGGGLDRYDPFKQQFSHIAFSDKTRKTSGGFINAIAEDAFDTIWLGTVKGLYRLDPDSDQLMPYQVSDGKETVGANAVNDLLADKAGRLWIASKGGLKRLDIRSGKMTLLTSDAMHSLALDSQQALWLTSNTALMRLEQGDRLKQIRKVTEIDKMAIDHKGLIWLGGRNKGLKLFDPQSKVLSHVNDDFVLSLDSDENKTLWLGTATGLKQLSARARLVGYYSHSEPADKHIMAIFQDSREQLWIGTLNKGVYRYGKNGELVKHYLHQADDLTTISSGGISSIVEDRHGDIWVGTLGGGLNHINQATHRASHYNYQENQTNSISHDSVHDLHIGVDGMVWIAGFRGLNRLDPTTGQVQRFAHQPNNDNSLSSDNLMEIYGDASGVLWLGTQKTGLVRFDPATGSFTRFFHHRENPNSLSGNFVTSITEDNEQQLWVATYGGGLNRFDKATESFQRFGIEDGLRSDEIVAVLADHQNRLWLSLGDGIDRFSPNSGEVMSLNIEDGLQQSSFYLRSAFKNAAGELFFGGINGYNRFSPEIEVSAKSVPSVRFTDFLLFNREVLVGEGGLSRSILFTDEITLEHWQNLFSFQFAAVGTGYPQALEYAYQLKGWDEQWLQTDGKMRFATYSNLPAGQYVLNVRARLPDTAWGPSQALTLTVLPPLWNTWWAWCLYVLATIALIVFIYSLELKKRTAELHSKLADKEKQLALKDSATAKSIANAKDQLLANISHEFRTPLTLILGPLTSLLNEPSADKRKAQVKLIESNARRLLVMVEQLLDLASLKNNQHSKRKHYDVLGTCRFICESFHSMAAQKQLSLEFFCDEQNTMRIEMVPDSLEKILSNLLSNAIKFTPETGKIEVYLSKLSAQAINITVCDNGPGIAGDDLSQVFKRFVRLEADHHGVPGVGIGLALVKELVDSHDGQVSVSSTPGKGCRFEVVLPLSESSAAIAAASPQVLALPPIAATDLPTIVANTHRPSVLIVEDNPQMSAYLLDCFKAQFHCISAADGEQGFELAKEHMPDMVISDVMMPKKDGFELAEMLKNDEHTCHIPIVLLTAKGDSQSRIKGWQKHVDEYVVKPFNHSELLARVDNLLSIRATLRRKFGLLLGKYSPVAMAEENGIADKDRQFIEKFEQCIGECFRQSELTRSDVAAKLYMTERQLNRKLSALFEHNFVEYLRKFRLRQSLSLLTDTEQSIAGIAESVGFTTPTYFARCFKAEYELSPNDYRQQQKAALVD